MGASKGLTRNARKIVTHGEMGLLSALEDRAWRHLDRGWELAEHRAWITETTRRQNAVAQLNLRFPGDDELAAARREEEMHALQSSFDPDPKT
jgi:hypothetical protein